MSPVFDGADEEEIAAELARAWLIDWRWRAATEKAWQWIKEEGIDEETFRTTRMPAGCTWSIGSPRVAMMWSGWSTTITMPGVRCWTNGC